MQITLHRLPKTRIETKHVLKIEQNFSFLQLIAPWTISHCLFITECLVDISV